MANELYLSLDELARKSEVLKIRLEQADAEIARLKSENAEAQSLLKATHFEAQIALESAQAEAQSTLTASHVAAMAALKAAQAAKMASLTAAQVATQIEQSTAQEKALAAAHKAHDEAQAAMTAVRQAQELLQAIDKKETAN